MVEVLDPDNPAPPQSYEDSHSAPPQSGDVSGRGRGEEATVPRGGGRRRGIMGGRGRHAHLTANSGEDGVPVAGGQGPPYSGESLVGQPMMPPDHPLRRPGGHMRPHGEHMRPPGPHGEHMRPHGEHIRPPGPTGEHMRPPGPPGEHRRPPGPHRHRHPRPPPDHTVGTMAAPIEHSGLRINFRPDDVLVATFPRSGTTWTIEVIRHLHLRHITDPDHALHQTHNMGGIFLNAHVTPAFLESVQSPRILKTHSYYSDMRSFIPSREGGKCKLIHVMRDPKDTFCSVYQHSKKMGHNDLFDNFIRRFINGPRYEGPGPGDWWLFTKEFLENEQNLDILYIKYEDLKHKTVETIRKLNDFLGYPELTDQDVTDVADATTFDKMKTTHFNVRGETSGKTGSHKDILSEADIKEINEKTADFLEKCEKNHLFEGKGFSLEMYRGDIKC